ncbi:MAG: hypothetical protein ACREBB_00685 [Nitrosotalea sp.]
MKKTEEKDESTMEQFESDKPEDIMKFVSSCNSLSELIDKLNIENVRLWHILDDTVSLKRELETPGISEKERMEILEKIAKKSFENIDTVKRRSIFKKAIDEVFIINVKSILEGKDVNVCKENKSYGR